MSAATARARVFFERAPVLERMLAAFVLFYGAMTFCLPVSEQVSLPWWASKISFGNVLLHEAIFFLWMLIYGRLFVFRVILNGGLPARQAALWLIALAIWCGAASLGAPLVLQDVGRSLRLILTAILLLAVVRWTKCLGDLPLQLLISGFLAGSLINLVISFQNPFVVNELMRLAGQNTPGVAMGIAIHVAAWLFLRTRSAKIQILAVIATLVCAFGCAISFSRVGWFCGALGIIAWFFVLFLAKLRAPDQRRRLRTTRAWWIPLLAIALTALFTSPIGSEGFRWVHALVEQKFSAEPGPGDSERQAYLVGVSEIVMRAPMGVGYSGFLDAMRATAVYKAGRAAEEVDHEANPHSALLYYTSAGGIPGGVIIVGVFLMLLNCVRVGLLAAFGSPGAVLFLLSALSFVLIALTVSYLVNSIILVVPAGIAAGWMWSRRASQPELSPHRT